MNSSRRLPRSEDTIVSRGAVEPTLLAISPQPISKRSEIQWLLRDLFWRLRTVTMKLRVERDECPADMVCPSEH
ncbi:hypothetical protein, partial [Halorubrum ezzemoulense]|uniref:hypothetical protein n=1 Tax=Halorubrum ezzemoulense TaxID=337243 RepID=UPI00232FA65A